MSNLSIFKFNDFAVRTAGTPDAPLFCASDVCAVLSIVDVSQAIERLDQDEVDILAKFGFQRTLYAGPDANAYVTESGLYSLIMTSRKPEAKAFKRWVTSEVLPSIRKTGQYSQKSLTPAEQLLASVQLTVELERKQREHDERLTAVERTLEAGKTELAAIAALPPASVEAPAKTDGMRTIECVRRYGLTHGNAFKAAFDLLFKEVFYRLRIDLSRREKSAKKKGLRVSDVIDASEKSAEIYAIARELFK